MDGGEPMKVSSIQIPCSHLQSIFNFNQIESLSLKQVGCCVYFKCPAQEIIWNHFRSFGSKFGWFKLIRQSIIWTGFEYARELSVQRRCFLRRAKGGGMIFNLKSNLTSSARIRTQIRVIRGVGSFWNDAQQLSLSTSLQDEPDTRRNSHKGYRTQHLQDSSQISIHRQGSIRWRHCHGCTLCRLVSLYCNHCGLV